MPKQQKPNTSFNRKNHLPRLTKFRIQIQCRLALVLRIQKIQNKKDEILQTIPSMKAYWAPDHNLVDNIAVLPDLTLTSREDINVTHFHHSRCKLISPSGTIPCVVPHLLCS